jgi:hypothetical protein
MTIGDEAKASGGGSRTATSEQNQSLGVNCGPDSPIDIKKESGASPAIGSPAMSETRERGDFKPAPQPFRDKPLEPRNPDAPMPGSVRAMMAEIYALRARVQKVEREKLDWVQAHTTLAAQYGEKRAFAREMLERAEAAERRLLPGKLSDGQREMLARAWHGAMSVKFGVAPDLWPLLSAGSKARVLSDVANFCAILSRIQKENADG